MEELLINHNIGILNKEEEAPAWLHSSGNRTAALCDLSITLHTGWSHANTCRGEPNALSALCIRLNLRRFPSLPGLPRILESESLRP